MNGDLVLTCPNCEAPALADDEFCESCGAPLGERRDGGRHHFEVDAASVAGVSDRGLVHRRNEDALFVETAGRGAVAVVCDGVSSSAAPQVAAQVAAELIGRMLTTSLARGPSNGRTTGAPSATSALAESLAAAGSAVVEVPWMLAADRDGPSCTVVAARWDGSTVVVGWAGDSRAYWVDHDGVERLTTDHSWAQHQITSGLMSLDEAEADARAHAITRWLGPEAPAEPAIATFVPETVGRLVLCTDGLWNHLVDDDELGALVGAETGEPPITLARRLVRAAIGRGGHDNVTVAVIDIDPSVGDDDGTEPQANRSEGR